MGLFSDRYVKNLEKVVEDLLERVDKLEKLVGQDGGFKVETSGIPLDVQLEISKRRGNKE